MSIHVRSVALRTWRSILRISLALIATLTMILGMMIGTEGGRIALIKQGVTIVELLTPFRIELAGLRSPGLGRLNIDQMSILGVTAVPQIQLNDVTVRWNWQYALQNRWWFSNVHAESLKLSMAEPERSSGENFSWLYQSWAFVPATRIERLRVDDLVINRPRYRPFESSMDAQLELNWGTEPARLIVGLAHDASDNLYALQLSADAIDEVRVQGTLNAEPNSAWADWLRWQLPEAARASWDFQVDYGQPGFLDIAINDWSLPWKNHRLKASGNLLYDIENIGLTFQSLDLSLDDKPALLSGSLSALDSDLTVRIDDWAVDPFSDLMGFSELTGVMQMEAQWFGGWRQPRLDGNVSMNGQWEDYPLTLAMQSQAQLSSLDVTQGELTLANNRIALTGGIDWLTEELNFNFQGLVQSDPLFRGYLPDRLEPLVGQGTIEGELVGSVTDPIINLNARGKGQINADDWRAVLDARWQTGTLQVSDALIYSGLLQAKGTLDYAAVDQSWSSQWAISELRSDLLDRFQISFPVLFEGTGSGNVSAAGIGTDYNVGGDLTVQGRWQQWPLNAQIDLESLTQTGLVLGDSTVQLGESKNQLSGEFSWQTGLLDLTMAHQDWPLSTLPPWLSFWPDVLSSLDGQWSGETTLKGLWNRPSIQTDSYLDGRWFNEPFTLALQTDPDSVTDWQVPAFTAQWLGATWQYQGLFKPYELWLDGIASIQNVEAADIPKLSESILGKTRRLPNELDLMFGGDVQLTGRITSPTLSGQISAQGRLDEKPFSGKVDLGYLDVNYAAIDHAEGQWADGEWRLDGLVDWRLNQMALTIETDSPNANHLVPWLQLALNDHPNAQWLSQWQGSLTGRLELDNRTKDWLIDGNLLSEGSLLEDDYRIQWQGQGRLNQALDHQVDIEWGVAEINGSLVSDATRLTGTTDIQWLGFEQIRGLARDFPNWIVGILNGRISIDGTWQDPNFSAQLATTGQFELNSAHRFNANIDLSGSRQGWSLKRTLLEIPRAVSLTIAGEGQGPRGELRVEGLLPDTQYFVSNPELGPGEAAFSLNASGLLMQPELTGELVWRAEQWPLELQADISSENGKYQVASALYSENQTQMKAKLEWPQGELRQWSSQWDQWPLTLDTAINADMSLLDPFLVDQPDIAISGQLQGQWSLNGPLTAPTWSGGLNWFNGAFEHANYGTRISDLTLSVVGNGSDWNLLAEGTDGSSGDFSTNGTVAFFADDSQILAHNIQMSLALNQAQLLNQAQMDAALSGAVDISGSYHDVTLSGDVRVNPLTLQSDTFLWDGAPQLNIVSSSAGNIQIQNQRPAYWPRGKWDVRLIAQNRVNLYGQGISAELTGDLTLTEDLYDPELSGRFDLVRGTYTGLGRVFELQSGSIQIQNSEMVLDIRGDHVAQLRIDGVLQPLTMTIRITGTRESLNLALSSDSNLDQDELLAQLLFGRIVADLDVIQAYQLALVVNKLRTGDSGFDFIGATRESFALDTLVVDTESDQEGNLQFNVSAGKYLNDFLYLEVEQDVGTEQEFRGSLQYQVTPSTNIEVYTQGQGGAFDDNGVELNWSFDY